MPAYKNDAGRWYCAFYYKDWTGKRRKKKKESFATKREALEWERRYIEEQAGAPTMSFEALYGLYKKDCACHLKKSTMISKFAMIDKHILPLQCFLTISEYGTMHNKIRKLAHRLDTRVRTLSAEDVLAELGFPNGWLASAPKISY